MSRRRWQVSSITRQSRSLRIAESERSLLKAVAERDGVSWSTWTREIALREAVRRLEEDHPDLRQGEGDGE